MSGWNRDSLFPPRVAPAAHIESVHCPRCLRTVERATTVIGPGGYRQCSNEALCTAASVLKRTSTGAY